MEKKVKRLDELADVTIGNRLKKARLRSGLLQETVADKLNIDVETYAKYERDKITPPVNRIIDLIYLLNTTADYILLGEEHNSDIKLTELMSECPENKRSFVIDMVKTLIKALTTP